MHREVSFSPIKNTETCRDHQDRPSRVPLDTIAPMLRTPTQPFSLSDLASTNQSNNRTDTSLPVAVPINDTGTLDMGTEVVIDGIVVTDKKKRRLTLYLVVLLAITGFVTTIAIYLIHIRNGSEGSEGPFTDQSHPPSTSSSPSSFFDYNEHVKNIAIQVSGEEALNNSSSIPYLMYLQLSENLPNIVDAGIVQLNDTKRLTQRFIMMVVRASGTQRFKDGSFNNGAKEIHYDECDLPFLACNEDNELTSLVYLNEKSTGGGGFIPTEVGKLTQLRQISASNNAFYGSIPSEIGALQHLRILDLKKNMLTGSIPTEIGQLTELELLDFSFNIFRKQIPQQFGNLKKVKYISLSHNTLTGSIPLGLGSLDELEGLKLDHNNITENLEFFCNRTSNFAKTEDVFVPGERHFFSYKLESGLTLDCG